MKKHFLLINFLFVLYVGLLTSQTFAQEAVKTPIGQSEQTTLKEILLELKQLRSTISKTNINMLRFQMTFEQLKAQQNRVESLTRQIEAIKELNANINPESDNRALEYIKTIEERLKQETDPNRRANLEAQLSRFKASVNTANIRQQRLKDRESTLINQLPFEQVKLDDLNNQMESIKRDVNSLLNQ
jgi:chromosome segregation ATPase